MMPFRILCRTLVRFAALVVAWIALTHGHVAVAQVRRDASSNKSSAQTHVAFSHVLPHLDGMHLKATIVEVSYGPGGSSPPHSHPCPVVGYVIEGALRTQVKGEAEAIYTAGQSFYEAPNGVHMLSANASDKAPVKFLAYFVCDHDTPLSVASPGTAPSGEKR
jgi:quercetin dioxygenase-like cupin family protein